MVDLRKLTREVVASPLGDVIASVGEGVAAAQNALDEGSLAAVLDIYSENDDQKLALLREIGYRPTFYALPETIGEVRVALRLGQRSGARPPASAARAATPAVSANLARLGLNTGVVPRMYATPVDAGYANQFAYSADISAKVTFKIVPIPAPEGADELRVVPTVTGLEVPAARDALEALGLEPAFVDQATGNTVANPDDKAAVAEQSPVAGTIARASDTVTLMIV
ncbi:MAG TPA: PASTA domain-containing protein [Thermohalobaculum sp.]|nr:PASTA domain-containing protein [Thermohalobaculum sp.]